MDALSRHGQPMYVDATANVEEPGGVMELCAVMRAPGLFGDAPAFAVFHLLTESRTEAAFEEPLARWSRRAELLLGHPFRPCLIVTDNDPALRPALCWVFNACSVNALTAEIKARLGRLHGLLASQSMLRVRLVPGECSAVLPLPGLNTDSAGAVVVPTIVEDVTPLFLCVGHFTHATYEHGRYGAGFRGLLDAGASFVTPHSRSHTCLAADKVYYQWLLMTLVRFAIANPLFAGPENWDLTVEYFKLVDHLLGLGPHLAVNTPLAPMGCPNSSAIVRRAVSSDARSGRPPPAHVLVVTFCGVEGLKIRIGRITRTHHFSCLAAFFTAVALSLHLPGAAQPATSAPASEAFDADVSADVAGTLRAFADLDASPPAPAAVSLAEDEEGDAVAVDPSPASGVVRNPLYLNRLL